ncbi:MAG: hypothetical protein ACM3SS_11085 [Rhodospirillaceae bacterium]
MPGWVLPALKAILPHVGTIVEAAKPVFRRATSGGEAKPTVEEQIAEVQAAITQNADHIKALAEQLQKTVAVLEQEAETTRQQLKRAHLMCAVALVVSLTAVGIALYAVLSA